MGSLSVFFFCCCWGEKWGKGRGEGKKENERKKRIKE